MAKYFFLKDEWSKISEKLRKAKENLKIEQRFSFLKVLKIIIIKFESSF